MKVGIHFTFPSTFLDVFFGAWLVMSIYRGLSRITIQGVELTLAENLVLDSLWMSLFFSLVNV